MGELKDTPPRSRIDSFFERVGRVVGRSAGLEKVIDTISKPDARMEKIEESAVTGVYEFLAPSFMNARKRIERTPEGDFGRKELNSLIKAAVPDVLMAATEIVNAAQGFPHSLLLTRLEYNVAMNAIWEMIAPLPLSPQK